MLTLLWLDLETTGLTDYKDHILEVSWQLTTPDLIELTPVSEYVVTPRPHTMRILDDPRNAVAKQMHIDTGLYADLQKPDLTMRLDVVEMNIISDIMAHTVPEDTVQLAGASVHFDKSFINAWMPELHERLHHRVYDTSTLKTFFEELGIEHGIENEGQHRAANDVREVLEVARRYRDYVSTMKDVVMGVMEESARIEFPLDGR